MSKVNVLSPGPTGPAGTAGAAGAVGPTGPTGPSGISAPDRMPSLVSAVPPQLFTLVQANTATLVGCRVTVPKSGVLHDISTILSAVAGNVRVGIYDTGDAVVGTRTLLYDSGSVAVAVASVWQVIGDPALAVTAGQQLDFAVVTDIAQVGCTASNANSYQLPASFWPAAGGVAPVLAWYKALAFGALPTPLATAGLTAVGLGVPALIARVS